MRSLNVEKKVELSSGVTSMEMTRDGSILVVTYGNTISFWDVHRCGIHNFSYNFFFFIMLAVHSGYYRS